MLILTAYFYTYHCHWFRVENKSIRFFESFVRWILTCKSDKSLSFHSTLLHQTDIKSENKKAKTVNGYFRWYIPKTSNFYYKFKLLVNLILSHVQHCTYHTVYITWTKNTYMFFSRSSSQFTKPPYIFRRSCSNE